MDRRILSLTDLVRVGRVPSCRASYGTARFFRGSRPVARTTPTPQHPHRLRPVAKLARRHRVQSPCDKGLPERTARNTARAANQFCPGRRQTSPASSTGVVERRAVPLRWHSELPGEAVESETREGPRQWCRTISSPRQTRHEWAAVAATRPRDGEAERN